MMRAISQELDEQSTSVIERVIVEGVKSGEFDCPDPTATAWVLVGLLDGLGVQLTVHDDVISREQLIKHVRRVAIAELGLPTDAFGTRNLRRKAHAAN